MNKNILKKGNKKKRLLKKDKKIRWFKILEVILFVLIIFVFICFSYQKIYAQKVYQGVRLGQFNVGGKTKEELKTFLEEKVNDISKNGFLFRIFLEGQTKDFIVQPVVISPSDPDLSREIINFKVQETVDECYNFGRGKDLTYRLSQIGKALLNGQQLDFKVKINKEELKNILKNNFQFSEKPFKNARLIIEEDDKIPLPSLKLVPAKLVPAKAGSGKGDKIIIEPEEQGLGFSYNTGIERLEKNLKNLVNEPIDFQLVTLYPEIKKSDTKKFEPEIEEILNLSSIVLSYKNKEWVIEKQEFKDWLEFNKVKESVCLSFKEDELRSYLGKIAQEINIEPKEAKFQINDSRVSEFQAPQTGLTLNLEKTHQKIENEVISNIKKNVALIVDIVEPKTSLGELNDLGIKELIGRGESNFSGSPKNRRHNIKVGAESLNGILIKPEEEFSLIKAIGEVNAERGYLPELVIKGDRTIPEYGGGLCQIGTTTFRVALDTGLPITERQPHSYRVVYYEPAGTDATIYNPHPDLKFINDTGNYILWYSEIQGDILIFEFWGTLDNREVEITEPKIFNVTSPGPTRIIKTEELEPGEKKCIERAHNGADTEFTRTIKSAQGEIKEEIWKSHYKAWPEVCLVGKELEERLENQEKIGESETKSPYPL